MLMISSKLFHFSNEANLSCLELYCVTVIKHVTFFAICAKLTLAFTFTGLSLNFYTSDSRCGCGFGFEQKYWWNDGFGEKKARIDGFAYSYSHPP